MKNKLIFSMAIALCLAMSGTAFAGQWEKSDQGWKYQQDDTTYAASQWIQDQGRWYYFDANQTMHTGWLEDAGVWYYLSEDGSMLTNATTPDNCWVGEDGRWSVGNNSAAINNAVASTSYKEPLKLYEIAPTDKKNVSSYGVSYASKVYSGESWFNSFVMYGMRYGLYRENMNDRGNGFVTYELPEDYQLLTARIAASDSMWGDLWYHIYVTGDNGKLLYESEDMQKEGELDLSVDIRGHRTISIIVEGGRYSGIVMVKDLTVQ